MTGISWRQREAQHFRYCVPLSRINSLLSYRSRNSLQANINALACMNVTAVGDNSFGKLNFTLALAEAFQTKRS